MLGYSPFGTASSGEVRGAVLGSGSVTISSPTAYGASFVIVPTVSTPITIAPLGRRSVKVRIDSATIPYYLDPRDPSDVSLYGMEIVGLPASESITSVVSVAASPTDLVIGTPSLNGLEISFLVTGGTSGVEYTITATIRTSTGETYNRSAILYTAAR